MNLIDVDNGIAFLHGSLHHHLDAFLEVAAILGTGKHLSHIHAVDASPLEAFRNQVFVDEFGETIDQSCLADSGFSNVERIVLLGTAEYLDGSVQFLLSSDERIVLFYLVRDAGNQLMPILYNLSSVFFLLIVIIVGIIVIIKVCSHAHTSLSSILSNRIVTVYARQKLALAVAHILTQQEGGFRILQAKHRLHEMRHIHQLSVGSSSQGACRSKHGLEERRRLWQILDGIRHTLLLGEPSHQVFVHSKAVYAFLLQRLTECILPEQRQKHVLGHHELVVEEPCLLHRIIHQYTHISG